MFKNSINIKSKIGLASKLSASGAFNLSAKIKNQKKIKHSFSSPVSPAIGDEKKGDTKEKKGKE